MDYGNPSRRLSPENKPTHLGRRTICCCYCSRVREIVWLGIMLGVGPVQAPGRYTTLPSAGLPCRYQEYGHQVCSRRAIPQLRSPSPTPSRPSGSNSGGFRSQAGPMGQAVASVVTQAPGRPRDAPSAVTCSIVHLGCTSGWLYFSTCCSCPVSSSTSQPGALLRSAIFLISLLHARLLNWHYNLLCIRRCHTVYYFVQTALHANTYCNESSIWFRVSGASQTLRYC